MICSTCRKVESTTSIWSAGWIAANMPPLPVCANCSSQHGKVGCVEGQQALDHYKAIKQFAIWTDSQFDSLQSEVLLNGDIIKGCKDCRSKSVTVVSRLLVSYKEDYWIVTKYSMLNLGNDTFWINRLEFR